MEGKRLLVTGGAGFIGSNLANDLAADNEVIAVDDCYLGTPENLSEEVEFVEASVLDEDLPTDVDAVVHLAALSSRAMLEEHPRQGSRVNVEGFVNVVEQAMADGCEAFAYASTSSIYDDDLPSTEDEEVVANTGYEASMLARERYGEYYDTFYDDLSVAGLRFFSVYQGYGGNEGHKGEFANTVSQWAEKVAEGESPVLWGDGEQTRDFTHVDDVVRAIEAILDARLSGVYNVGTGRNFSFNELVAMLNDALGTDVDPVYEPIPLKHYNHQQRSDPSKLREATGWEPRIDFEDGIGRVCEPYLD
ncbi:nucleoside-diphosphate sugar epimerase [Halobacteriales archaeon QS_8_69_26]|nr:MAG: nucleoside-diphosphate sugar epimerase [Halobacteriales archaeon QS_8_69_26]